MQVTHILSCGRGEGRGGNNIRNTSSHHFLQSTTAVDIYKLWAIALTNAGCHQTRVQETFGACMTYNSLGKRKMTLQFAVFAHAESLCKCSWACKQMMTRKVLWLGTFSQMFTFCSQRTLEVFGQKYINTSTSYIQIKIPTCTGHQTFLVERRGLWKSPGNLDRQLFRETSLRYSTAWTRFEFSELLLSSQSLLAINYLRLSLIVIDDDHLILHHHTVWIVTIMTMIDNDRLHLQMHQTSLIKTLGIKID